MPVTVVDICRYPVKGLSAEHLERIALSPHEPLPNDRRFAIALGTTEFDPERPEWMPKTKFLMLMRNEQLAQLRTVFDDITGVLTIGHRGDEVLRAKVTEADGRATVAQFFADFVGEAARGTPKMLEAPGHAFSDARQKPGTRTFKYVSIINVESVRAVENEISAPVDPIRFRGNIYIEDAPPWSELDWTGSDITIGSARLYVASRIDRCAATTVNPETAERDLDVPGALKSSFGHVNMGIYAEVVEGGAIAVGDQVIVPS